MMLRIIFIALVVVLFGCGERKEVIENPRHVLKNYRCTDVQITQVDRLFKICNESDYFSSFCYEQAVIASCDYLGRGEDTP